MSGEPIALAADHAGFELKSLLALDLKERGRSILDVGTFSTESVDYPDFANALAKALSERKAGLGIAICGTGIGISIALNRHRHIRAALCSDTVSAQFAREHNDANVLALGARLIGVEVARACVSVFLSTVFAGGRHVSRVAKLG